MFCHRALSLPAAHHRQQARVTHLCNRPAHDARGVGVQTKRCVERLRGTQRVLTAAAPRHGRTGRRSTRARARSQRRTRAGPGATWTHARAGHSPLVRTQPRGRGTTAAGRLLRRAARAASASSRGPSSSTAARARAQAAPTLTATPSVRPPVRPARGTRLLRQVVVCVTPHCNDKLYPLSKCYTPFQRKPCALCQGSCFPLAA